MDSVNNQKSLWPKLAGKTLEDGRMYSYGWGDPESSEARNASGMILGDYKKIKDEYLLPNIVGKTVLELGSFDGKWVNYMGEAKRVICADLDSTGFDVIKDRLKWDTLEFYECTGRDFKGIPDGSVDFVFCMDSLVRSEREILNSYIAEIKRILASDGKMCVHMPAQDQHMSWELGFTQIGSQEILQLCRNYDIKNAVIDNKTVNHGILILNF